MSAMGASQGHWLVVSGEWSVSVLKSGVKGQQTAYCLVPTAYRSAMVCAEPLDRAAILQLSQWVLALWPSVLWLSPLSRRK
jgi:hypothetical protein